LLFKFNLRQMIKACCLYLSKRKLRRQIINKKANLNALMDSDLSYMNLSNIDIRGAKMSASNLKRTVFKNTVLQGAVINSANLCGANFSGANLSFVNFSDSNMRFVNLRGANLYKVDFSGANLCYADLTDARIDITTNFTNANMRNVIVNTSRLKIAITEGAIIQPMGVFEEVLYSLSIKSHNTKKIVPILDT